MTQTSKSTKRKLIISLIILLVVIAAAIGTYKIFRPVKPRCNVILILLDTVRADRLGCYGNELGLTPNIDKFAETAICFDNAFSQAPWTLPSVASLYTSQYPIQHGAGGRYDAVTALHENSLTIADIFQKANAATHAIINVLCITDKFNMTTGYATVDVNAPIVNTKNRRAGPTTKAALEWLEQNKDDPFFLFVHYFDAHLVYDPPQPFRKQFAHPQDKYNRNTIFGNTNEDLFELRTSNYLKLSNEKVERLEKLYNGEIAYLDSELGNLFKGISRLGLDSDTVIVITADHGEEFHDHGGFEHGHSLYDELLHVPLLIGVPEKLIVAEDKQKTLKPGSHIDTTVRLIDIAPTLCELAGIDPPPQVLGQTLTGFFTGQSESDRPVLSNANVKGPDMFAWRKNNLKIIHQKKTDKLELYDIKVDPKEQQDLSTKQPKLLDKMLTDMRAVIDIASERAAQGKEPKLTPQEKEKLRSLGYLN